MFLVPIFCWKTHVFNEFCSFVFLKKGFDCLQIFYRIILSTHKVDVAARAILYYSLQ